MTTDAQRAVLESDLSLVCVGTPSAANGSQDQTAVLRLAREIGRAIGAKHDPHIVVFRSTLVPGTVETVLRPLIEEASGKRDGDGFFLCFQPEFLREGSSIRTTTSRHSPSSVPPMRSQSNGCVRCSGTCRARSSRRRCVRLR